MDDGDLAVALAAALVTERDARAHWQAAPTLAEQQTALAVVRLVTPVIRCLEQWITARALRAAK